MTFDSSLVSSFISREKAFAALAAFDAKTGHTPVYEWNAPEEVAQVAPLSAKERKRLQRERAKALKAVMPPLLKAIQAKPESCLANFEEAKAEDVPFDSVICDWLSISHPLDKPYPVVNDGRILRINADGSKDWSYECWNTLKCPSSDTSLRIKCDGFKIMMTGNIGRFGQSDNMSGHTVSECVELWRKVLAEHFPARIISKVLPQTREEWLSNAPPVTVEQHYEAVDLSRFFGDDIEIINRSTGEVEYVGTRITRCDLAGNFYTDNFSKLTEMLMTRKLGQRPPRMGNFGPMWGYGAKRANWFKAKVYDKTCELEGRRTPSAGETVARFEVQLGSEFLKNKGLNKLVGWVGGEDMENVIFMGYSRQVFQEQTSVENWKDIPSRIRHYAVLWRDGVDLRNQCTSQRTYYRVLKALREYGIDASQPCNILTLTRRIEVVKVQPLQARRVA